jgi:hypothetical protein
VRDRIVGRAAGWVWLLTGLLTIGSALGSALLFLNVTGGSFSETAWWIIGAGAAISVSGMVAVPAASGNQLTPAYIVIAALPLISKRLYAASDVVIGVDAIFTLQGSMSAMLGGLAALAVFRTARGTDQREVAGRFTRRLLVFSTYLVIFEMLAGTEFLLGSEWRRLVVLSMAGLGAFVVEGLADIVFTGRIFGGRLRHGLASSASDAAVFVSLIATGALFGLAFEAIQVWALAVAVLPYAFTAGAFRRLSQTKRTYEQTLVALAQIPEVGGHTQVGHAARTNDLATAIAERIGVSRKDYERINYASFLHDIGRITLNEPSILRQGFTDVDLAGWGAEIVGETKYLEDVATIVRRQYEPFRSPGEVSNPDLPLASRIIKVCSAYDESVHEMGFSPLEALERIHRGTVYDFDPDVVRELRAVLERRGTLNHPATITPG